MHGDLFRNDSAAIHIQSMIRSHGRMYDQQVSRVTVDSSRLTFVKQRLNAPASWRIQTRSPGIVSKRRHFQCVDVRQSRNDRKIRGIRIRIVQVLPCQIKSVDIQLLHCVNQDRRAAIDRHHQLLNTGID